MSLGIYRSIRGCSTEREANQLIQRINIALAQHGLPAFEDADPDERGLRPLPCGNASARAFISLERLITAAGLSWSLSDEDGFQSGRFIALPLEIREPIEIRLPWLWIFSTRQTIHSARALHTELIAIAPLLKIPLDEGKLNPAVAELLQDCNALSADEPLGWMESERGLWHDLYAASLYCLEDGTPLIIGP